MLVASYLETLGLLFSSWCKKGLAEVLELHQCRSSVSERRMRFEHWCMLQMCIIETHGYHLLKMAQMGWLPITGPVSEGKYLPWKKISDARQTVDANDLVQMETVGGDLGRSYPLSAHHYTSFPAQWCPRLNGKPLLHITSFLGLILFFFNWFGVFLPPVLCSELKFYSAMPIYAGLKGLPLKWQ